MIKTIIINPEKKEPKYIRYDQIPPGEVFSLAHDEETCVFIKLLYNQVDKIDYTDLSMNITSPGWICKKETLIGLNKMKDEFVLRNVEFTVYPKDIE